MAIAASNIRSNERLRMFILTLAFSLLPIACVVDPPDEGEGRFSCESASDCVSGYACVDGFCDDGTAVLDAGASDAASSSDVGVMDAGEVIGDAAIDDAGVADASAPDAGSCTMTSCGSACVDLTTDREHCGACNRSCGGGDCIAAVCQLFVWQDLPGARPTRLVADGDHLYWTQVAPSGAIMRKPLDRSAAAESVAMSQSYPDRLVVDATHVFWTALEQTSGARPGHIRYRDKALANPTFEVTSATQRSPDGLAVSNGVVLWTEDSPLYLRAHLVGRPVDDYVELRFSGGSSYAQTMVADNLRVYWFDSQANLFAHPIGLPEAPSPEPIFTQQDEEPKSAAMADGWIYFGDSANGLNTQGFVRRVNTSTHIVQSITANANPGDASHGVFEVATSGTHLYYTTESSSGRHGRVYRVPLTGGSPELLRAVPGANDASARGVATVGAFVYWAEWSWSGSAVDGAIVGLRID